MSSSNRTPAPGASRRWTDVPQIDPRSWSGALILMCGFAALLWIVEIIDSLDDYQLNRFGLEPRELAGLWGVLTAPFLHTDFAHLASNTLPVLLVGWVLMLSGLRTWLIVTAFVVVVGGLLTWLVGPSNTVIVGASGLVFGWLGYLLARAWFSRQLKWILVAVAVLFFFGTLLFGLFPTLHSGVSWQAHVCGFVAGVGAGALLHPRGGEMRLGRRSAVS
ncbi:MAG TPA: rhomboid family intramembrane serine protease [Jatrophihabitans sp.]|nr:rhomboid family intramembrane serine protease [Jatrophihabitans sp.]